MWCTGYQKVMDFLSPDCALTISETGHMVEPLYMHYINIHYPTMAVLHLNPGNVPFPQMDLQVIFRKSCWFILQTSGWLVSLTT